MVFVTTGGCKAQLERLTKILVCAFPGSTIYQHTDLSRVPHDVLTHKVDAVLLDADNRNSGDLMQKLRRQRPELPVFMIAESAAPDEKSAAAGASGCFVLPDDQQRLLDAIRMGK